MLSHRCRRSFDVRNLTVRRGRAVHEVDWMDGLGGHQYPAPGCHVGNAGFALAAFRPTCDPVSCERCLHNIRARVAPGHVIVMPGQLALDLDVA